MQGNNSASGQTGGQSGSQPGQKQGGLSWSSPAAKPATPPVSFSTTGANTAQTKPATPPITPIQSKPFTPPLPKTPPMSSTPMNKTQPAQKSGSGKVFGIFAAGIIVGFLIGWGWSSTRPNSDEVTENTKTPTTNTATGAETGSTATNETTPGAAGSDIAVSGSGSVTYASAELTVPATQPAGTQVMVTNAVVSKPTWVLVYESINGKQSGKSLGGMIFFPATKSGTLDLLRPTIAGHTYMVVQNVDDGDFVFSTAKDMPVHDAQGALVSATFQAQ